jgi:hypothetical protein
MCLMLILWRRAQTGVFERLQICTMFPDLRQELLEDFGLYEKKMLYCNIQCKLGTEGQTHYLQYRNDHNAVTPEY